MRPGNLWHRLHGLDSQNPEVGFPALELEERVVIKAQPDGQPLSPNGLVEHATESPSLLKLKNWCFNSPGRTQAGVMTELSAPWLIWGITFPARPSTIFCSDRDWARHPNVNATPPGPSSSAGTRPCSGPPTSSPLKSGPPPA